MAKEKIIHGKVDNGKHEGKASEVRRIEAAEFELKDYQGTFRWPKWKPAEKGVQNATKGK